VGLRKKGGNPIGRRPSLIPTPTNATQQLQTGQRRLRHASYPARLDGALRWRRTGSREVLESL